MTMRVTLRFEPAARISTSAEILLLLLLQDLTPPVPPKLAAAGQINWPACRPALAREGDKLNNAI